MDLKAVAEPTDWEACAVKGVKLVAHVFRDKLLGEKNESVTWEANRNFFMSDVVNECRAGSNFCRGHRRDTAYGVGWDSYHPTFTEGYIRYICSRNKVKLGIQSLARAEKLCKEREASHGF